MCNDSGIEFEYDNICAILRKREFNNTTEKNAVLNEIDRFKNGAEQHDDITIVIIRAIERI